MHSVVTWIADPALADFARPILWTKWQSGAAARPGERDA